MLAQLAGRELAFLAKRPADRHPGLFVANADGTAMRRIDKLPGDKQTPNWSPDGRRIAFRWSLGAETDTRLAIIDADGSGFVNLTKRTGLRGWAPSWSPDGRRLVAAATLRVGVPPSLYVMNDDGSRLRRLTRGRREAQYATWSPGGAWIAFTFVVDGGFDIFKIRPDGSDLTRLTADGAGGSNNWPMWSPDGTQIAYGRQDGLWLMNADGSEKHSLTDVGGVPGAWAPGPFPTFQCPRAGKGFALCVIRSDGTELTRVLGGIDAGFPGWKPHG